MDDLTPEKFDSTTSIPSNAPTFDSFGLLPSVLQALNDIDFKVPTKIQADTIPPALAGRDILGSAQTGTGKTLAFGIPLISYLLNNPDETALILAPTRELAMQVLTALKQVLGKKSSVRASLLIGGESIFRQLTQLRMSPRLIVGTPGRVNDHLARGTLKLNRASFIVFDETDRMLDMGFAEQLETIVAKLPEKRQTLLFSATMAPNIIKAAQAYLDNPLRISVGSTTTPIASIKQEVVRITHREKYPLLLEQLQNVTGSCVIFVRTKMGTEELAAQLQEDDHPADAIHGDLRQRNREQVIRSFREEKFKILVATDVAARGLDIPHVTCVINYDLPECPEDYIHRIGRTGRAGAEGKAISFVSPKEASKWASIARMMDPTKPEQNRSAPSRSGGFDRSSRGGNAGGRPSFGDRRGNSNEGGFRGRPAFGDRRSGADDSRGRPAFGERRSGGDDSRGRPAFGERRSGGDDSRGRPAFGEKRGADDSRGRPAFGERRSGGDDSRGRPAFGERRGADDSRGRPAFGDRRGADDSRGRPAFGERRGAPSGQAPFDKPFGGRPSFGERRSSGDNSRFEKPRGDRAAFGDRGADSREGGARFPKPTREGRSSDRGAPRGDKKPRTAFTVSGGRIQSE